MLQSENVKIAPKLVQKLGGNVSYSCSHQVDRLIL